MRSMTLSSESDDEVPTAAATPPAASEEESAAAERMAAADGSGELLEAGGSGSSGECIQLNNLQYTYGIFNRKKIKKRVLKSKQKKYTIS